MGKATRARLAKFRRDMQYAIQQYKQFTKLSDNLVKKGLSSPDPRIRFAALLAAGDQRLPIYDKYVDMFSDEDGLVRQASRRALILISADRLSPGWEKAQTEPKFVDFGPTPFCTEQEHEGSVELWKAWLEEQIPDTSEDPFRSAKKRKE